jgi:hypothetical protein
MFHRQLPDDSMLIIRGLFIPWLALNYLPSFAVPLHSAQKNFFSHRFFENK